MHSNLSPAEVLSQLAQLAAAKEVSFDLGKQQALVWRMVRQPEDCPQLAKELGRRLDKVMACLLDLYCQLTKHCTHGDQQCRKINALQHCTLCIQTCTAAIHVYQLVHAQTPRVEQVHYLLFLMPWYLYLFVRTSAAGHCMHVTKACDQTRPCRWCLTLVPSLAGGDKLC